MKRSRFAEIPASYRILPAVIDLRIPGFEADCQPGTRTLAPVECDCTEWYDEFVERLIRARSKIYLPVCRLSDGEYRFALGRQPPDSRLPVLQRWRVEAAERWRMLRSRGNFVAATPGRYGSGTYSRKEQIAARDAYGHFAREISERGLLALHLTFGTRPFQEHYHPALARWLSRYGIRLTTSNYVPFYFVYAALTGRRSRELLSGRVLVVHGADGRKRDRIERGLLAAGASDVEWHSISATRSLYDRVSINPHSGRVDLALVGAGLGKLRVLGQLAPLAVPCIDAGFVFEVWADPAAAHERPFCRQTS